MNPSIPIVPMFRSLGQRAVLGLPLGALLLLAWRSDSPIKHPPSVNTRTATTHSVNESALLDSTTWLTMRNVQFRELPNAVIQVRRLNAQVIPTSGSPPFLDDPRSFKLRITNGVVAIAGADLTVLLNTFVFGYPGAPITKLRVRLEKGQLVQTGVMHKGVDLPFEMTASVSLASDGRVRIHPERVKMLGINGLKLLHAVGLHLEKLLDLSKAKGATVKGDDMYLDPTAFLPPPSFDGRLAAIRIEGNELVQEFVTLPDDSLFGTMIRADSTVPNYLYFRGGNLRFGKLEMRQTDLLIADAEPKDPFDLFLAHYKEQLFAGTSQTLRNFGLRVVMPDFHSLPADKAVAKGE
jgi:hypothetical protein